MVKKQSSENPQNNTNKQNGKISSYNEDTSNLNNDDDISDIDDEQISQEAQTSFITDEFKQSVIKYIKIDDIIRQRQEDIKELNEQKKPYEEFILRYLDKVEQNMVEFQGSKLRKNQSETKMPIKMDIIKEAIFEGIKNEPQSDEGKCKQLVEQIVELMETKREKKVRVNVKRTFNKDGNADTESASAKSKKKN